MCKRLLFRQPFLFLGLMNTFIITAGGIGKRMESDLPKQFLLLKGKPVLLRTLERFYEADPTAQIFITLPNDWIDYWNELLSKYHCQIPHEIIAGGIERYDSVNNALKKSTGTIIGVHDGVRPLVSLKTIKACIAGATQKGSGVPCLPAKESIRKITPEGSSSCIRREYVLVQTPQCFSAELLRKAYQLPYHSAITDDASLVEESGGIIHLVEGNEENIKITTPVDMKMAESFL